MARDRDSLPVVLVAAIPVVAIRLSVGFLRFQARRKRGVQRFRATLMQSGMPREQAARLAQSYHGAGSLRKALRAARATGARRHTAVGIRWKASRDNFQGPLARGRSRSRFLDVKRPRPPRSPFRFLSPISPAPRAWPTGRLGRGASFGKSPACRRGSWSGGSEGRPLCRNAVRWNDVE